MKTLQVQNFMAERHRRFKNTELRKIIFLKCTLVTAAIDDESLYFFVLGEVSFLLSVLIIHFHFPKPTVF